MPGPGKKPHNLKVVAGTARPDRDGPPLVELPLIDEVPPAPDWLPNAHAIKEWNRLAPILVANKLLTSAAISPLGHMCALHGKLNQLWAAGESPNASMLAQYRALANDFGLTPVAQGKVRPHGDEPAKNEFSQNGRKPEAAPKRRPA
jgi:phage terminase small subunit